MARRLLQVLSTWFDRRPSPFYHTERPPLCTTWQERKGKEEYLYSAFSHQGTSKVLRHGSHSFTCKQHHACLWHSRSRRFVCDRRDSSLRTTEGTHSTGRQVHCKMAVSVVRICNLHLKSTQVCQLVLHSPPHYNTNVNNKYTNKKKYKCKHERQRNSYAVNTSVTRIKITKSCLSAWYNGVWTRVFIIS